MEISRENLLKQAKVVDMMLTMHSVLASRYRTKAEVLDICLLVSSSVIVATTFIDPLVLSELHFSVSKVRILIGIASILVFVLTIVSLIVDWKGKGQQHREAFNALIPLKSEWKDMVENLDFHDARTVSEFSRKSALIMGSMIPVPDGKFNTLKAMHHKKILLSKMVSLHPGASVHLLKLLIFFKSNKKAVYVEIPE